jgi:hypothetical protein
MRRRRIRRVISRSGKRRRELGRQCRAVEKHGVHWRTSEHAYRDKEREENRGQVVCKTVWRVGGEGYSYEPMHRY